MFLGASDRLGIIAASADEMPVLGHINEGHINEDHPSRASTQSLFAVAPCCVEQYCGFCDAIMRPLARIDYCHS